MIVLDASVACKLTILEDGSPIATELVEQAERVLAPSIIRLEVTGAVLRRFRMGHCDQDDARETLTRWERMLDERFEPLIAMEKLHDDAVDLALRMKHPLVDCLYLAAAMMLSCPLITADAKLCERGLSVYEHVNLLTKAA